MKSNFDIYLNIYKSIICEQQFKNIFQQDFIQESISTLKQVYYVKPISFDLIDTHVYTSKTYNYAAVQRYL